MKLSMKPFITNAILSEIPKEGMHFRELYRRLRRKGILSSDKTLKRYLDQLIAEGFLDARQIEEKHGPPIPRKIFRRTEKTTMSYSAKAQIEGETLAKVASALIRERCPGDVKGIIVFGSITEDKARENSDVDILIITDDEVDPYAFTKDLYGLINPIIYEVRRFISLHVYGESEVRRLLEEGSRFMKKALNIDDVIK